MWAAFKSDLQEFVSGAAEETSAVASVAAKVVPLRGEDDHDGTSAGGGGSSAASATSSSFGIGSAVSASVSAVSAVSASASGWSGGSASGSGGSSGDAAGQHGNATSSTTSSGWGVSMGGVNVKGLSSMFGGPIGPDDDANASSETALPKSNAVATMLARQEDDEEEELGWDDDDDDINLEDDIQLGETKDFVEEQLGNTDDGAVTNKMETSLNAFASADSEADDTKELLSKLQSKLDIVEKERSNLQVEHRRQTAELVELRSKVEEFERMDLTNKGGSNDAQHLEVESLQKKIEELQLQLKDQQFMATPSGDDGNMLASLVKEKTQLENELNSLREQNELLSKKNDSLMQQQEVSNDGLTNQYESQIAELKAELKLHQDMLESANAKLSEQQQPDPASIALQQQKEKELEEAQEQTRQLQQELADLKEAYSKTMELAEESTARLEQAEKELKKTKEEMEQQALNSAATMEEEVEKVKNESAADSTNVMSEQIDKVDLLEEVPVSPSRLAAPLDVEVDDDWGDGDW